MDGFFDLTEPPPDAPAILAPGMAPLTYADLTRLVESTGACLAEMGVGREDRVAMVLPNGPSMATAFLGVIASAIGAPLNPQYTVDELRFYLSDLRPSALIVDVALDTPARDVAASLGVPVIELHTDASGVSGICTLDGARRDEGRGHVRAARPSDVALLLHTSGTTSRPKLVPLSHANLATSARNVAQTLGLGPEDRCFNVMPLFHIHGLVAALLASLQSGGSIVCTGGFQAAHVVGWMDESRPTWYTAVPTIHRAMLDAVAAGSRRPVLRFIRSSSAALPTSLLEDLEETLGAPVIEAYGMTEAAHQIASNPRSPARKAGSVGPAAGPEIAIVGDDQAVLPAGEIGEIVIRGPNVMTGYLDNPDANAAAFVDGWFRTGDQGTLDDDGYLTITGRLKEIINRGGEKVAPTEVEDALLAHPDVTQAAVFAAPHPRLGEDVAAAVVLRADSIVSQGELRHFVAERLAPFKVPRRIVFVGDIPKGPTGKVQRVGMATRLGLDAPGSARLGQPVVEPRDETERELTRIFADVLQLDAPVGVTDDFVELGADSLHLEELLAEIEDVFHRSLPAALFLGEATPERLAALLRAGSEDLSDVPMIVPIQPGGSRPPLFCVMRAGTLVTARHFAAELGADQPIFGIWMPEMHGDADAAGGVEEIAATCRHAVTEVQPAGPYYLFGYSLGGLVVYEMARQFAASGESVGLVVMADTPYPVPLPTLGDHVAKLLSRKGPPAVARRLRRAVGRFGPPRARVGAGEPGTEARTLAEPLVSDGVDGQETILRERRYVGVPRPPAAPVVLLSTRHTMERLCGGSPALGWEQYVDDDWEVHEVPGSHDSMLGEPHVHVLAAMLSSCLQRAQERPRR